MPRQYIAITAISWAVICCCATPAVQGATPIVVQNEAGFEGLEEPKVIYFPATNTFQNDPTNFQNHVDEGGGLFRDTLRNEYPSPLAPYAAGPGWWDGDGADSSNTDRQRSEPKGIVGLGHQQVEQTFEYSFDFRTDPTFTATSSFCHIFQLKATNGDDSPPLATISLYKSGSGIQGRVDSFTDGTNGTPQTEIIPTTFSYTAGQWIHFVIRITPCAQGESTGGIQLSVNGSAFAGITNQAIDLQGSTDFRPKFGFYRGISTTNGVPVGDSWVEHRTITGYEGSSNVLTWQGGQNNNTWDTATTANFLNGSSASIFNTIDQINFTNSSNTTINISGNVWPDFAYVNSSSNYTFQGTGAITGGTLRKDGAGTLTLATTNSYAGLTDIRAGTLFVTGSIGNNSLVSLTGGTLKAGSTTALGTNSTIGTQIAGGTLDINGFNLSTEPISVQGAGVGNAGAIINSGAQQTNALTNVTLTGDTTLGGTGRWDIRGASATLSTGGNSYNLTKTGANQISLVGTNVDSTLGNITINQGELCFQTSTSSMGDPTKSVTVASGAALGFYNTAAAMTKICTLNGGTIWGESGTGTQNTFAGPITLGPSGGTFDAGSALTGGTPNASAVLNLAGAINGTGHLTKNGPGAVVISGSSNTFTGGTTVNAGALSVNGTVPGSLIVNSGGTLQGTGTASGTVTISSGGFLSPGTASGTGALSLGTLNLSSGATTTIQLGGASPIAQYDQLHVGGQLAASGTLSVSLINSYVPTSGTSFDILDWGSLNGRFSSVQLPALTAPMGWDTSHFYSTGVVTATSFVPGDLNRDGQVTLADLSALMNALTDVTNYESADTLTSSQFLALADLNGDGQVTNADIQSLSSLIASNASSGIGNGTLTAVPEPASIALLISAAITLLFVRPGSCRLVPISFRNPARHRNAGDLSGK